MYSIEIKKKLLVKDASHESRDFVVISRHDFSFMSNGKEKEHF